MEDSNTEERGVQSYNSTGGGVVSSEDASRKTKFVLKGVIIRTAKASY
jgi:hypothetical protein